MVNILLQLIFLFSLNNVKAANILAVLPTPTTSPQYVYTSLLKGILERNHEITLVTANPALANDNALENITVIDLSNKLNSIWQKHNRILVSDFNRDVVSEVSLTLSTYNYLSETLLKTEEMKKLLEEKNTFFDLLLLEASMTPLLSLSHIFKIPVILISPTDAPLDTYEIVGASTHPFIYPSIFHRRIYNLTALDKVVETSTYIKLKLKIVSNEKKVDLKLKENFGSNFPSLHELKRHVIALFLNSNPVWSGSRPVSSNVVFMDKTTTKDIEPLPQDFQTFLNTSRNGVIYVSFGNIIKPTQLPPEKLLAILNVLSMTPYDVLLKWDNDRLPGAPKNIKIYKWLPQSLLLAHPKIKLFITQGGIQSTFEAIHGGVPLIGIPMCFDNWYNTEKYVHFHIGLQLDLASLTEEKLMEAIHLVVKNKSYRTSLAELRTLMYDQPGSSMGRAIWWIEQALKPYARQHLRPPAANMTWREYLEFDFIFFVLLVTFVIMIVFFVFVTLIFRYICNSFKDIKKKVS